MFKQKSKVKPKKKQKQKQDCKVQSKTLHDTFPQNKTNKGRENTLLTFHILYFSLCRMHRPRD